jgi:polygalacturonase
MLSISDFGAVGDGKTLNTKAFNSAIDRIRNSNNSNEGTLLYVPRGVYLTQSFNLTSHMTLYLADGAVIKAVQDTEKWPLTDPLPSYGRGREHPGRRYISFIHGDGLNDVVITGCYFFLCQLRCRGNVSSKSDCLSMRLLGRNGTIDGQGEPWWNMWRHGTLKFTRPGLIEFNNSTNILVSHVVLQNSPFWTLHPVYCRFTNLS